MQRTQVPHLDKHTVGRLYKLELVIKLVITQWAMILQMLWFKGGPPAAFLAAEPPSHRG